MSQASSIVLAISMLAAGYLAAICSTPPNPTPSQENRHKTDRISPLIDVFATTVRRIAVTVITYHVFLILVPIYATNRMTQLCPRPENLNSTLFTWSTTSITALAMTFLGAYIRLSAYGGLGRNFTFHLAEPDQLVTSGVYRYMQHPSYTGQMLVAVGCAALFFRWDGSPACWISESTLARVDGWGVTIAAGSIACAALMLGFRVKDEEDMMGQKFGKQWEEWHRSTRRFVPGLF